MRLSLKALRNTPIYAFVYIFSLLFSLFSVIGVREDRSRGGRSKYYGNLNFQQTMQKRQPIIDSSPLGIKRMRLPEMQGSGGSYPTHIVPEIMQVRLRLVGCELFNSRLPDLFPIIIPR